MVVMLVAVHMSRPAAALELALTGWGSAATDCYPAAVIRGALSTFLVAIAASALSVGAAGAAAPTTTGAGPGTPAYAFVVVSDKKIELTIKGAGPKFARGDLVAFNVHNIGKKKHNFVFQGKATRAIGPGKYLNSRWFFLLRRGKFMYKSTLNSTGASFSGYITVGDR